jgi:hypothetical protein
VTGGQIFVVNISGKNVIIAMDNQDTVMDIKKKFENKEGMPAEEQILTFNNKIMNDYIKMAEHDVKKGSTLRMSARLRGGVFNVPQQVDTAETLTATLAEWVQKLNELETENEKLKKKITEDSKKSERGLRKVVQNSSKELAPKKFQNIAVSGSFKAWSRELKDYAQMADPTTLELFKYAENAEEKVDVELLLEGKAQLDQDLHYFVGRFLEGESKMLALNAEIGEFGEEYKSGTELWRLLVLNYDKKSAYNVVNVVQMIRKVEKAKIISDVRPKIATLERLYVEYAKGFSESEDSDAK